MKVINGLYSGVSTVELDDIAAETAAMLSNEHPDYAILAARIEVSNLHKETKKSFSEVIEDLNIAGNGNNPLHTKMDEKFCEIVKKNDEVLNSTIIYDRDFSFSYFGIKIFEKEYLRKINGKIVERPQHMFMRIAVAIHGSDIPSVIETYNLISGKYYMPSESAMRNAGFYKAQLMSACCLSMKSDSIEGIYSTVKEFALLSRSGMTVGMNIHCIRAKGSYIAGTNGNSNGIMPMLRVFNGTARGSHHGGKKESSFLTIYLEPWHADIFDFLNLKRTSGKDEQRARDLSYALWVPDLFMKRVREDAEWCLMCPHDSEILQNLFGDDFEEKYTQFEREGRFNRKVKARQVWDAIYESQMETGGPMILYKDNCNRKSNQSNIGTLLSSSHTGEMMSVTSSSEIPTCASGTVCLDMFVQQDKSFDFSKLKEYVKVITRSLNKVLEVNYYRTPSAEEPSSRNKPIAIAVQGLADVFILMRWVWASYIPTVATVTYLSAV
ncbi:UNVERIFIED_CONTAM: hypothetical protein GTU68_045892 [Idotea baltica]|nr:hypothetical protein [Idotea baltica]